MAYYCRVERDSLSPTGSRLTTFVITFPRIVLAEVVTHRLNSDTWGDCEVTWCERTTTPDISKNSASSRAIPFEKMLHKIKEDPFMPLWTINQRGMQGVPADPHIASKANCYWEEALDKCITCAEQLASYGLHKQDINRLLEPWMWVAQVVTSARWDNFFALRCHKAAHPAFQKIARMMYLERRKSTPVELKYGQWHLPFVPMEEQMKFHYFPMGVQAYDGGKPVGKISYGEIPDLIKHSAARCAWVSYENHDKDGSTEALLRTFDRLLAEVPVHASPVEHQATYTVNSHLTKEFLSNLSPHWIQARKLLPQEEIKEYNPSEEEIASWGLEENNV